jgi:hypothetical protein
LEVSGQIHASVALPPGKSPGYRRFGGPQYRSGQYGKVKNFDRTETRTPAPLGSPARSQSLYRLSYYIHVLENYGSIVMVLRISAHNSCLFFKILQAKSSCLLISPFIFSFLPCFAFSPLLPGKFPPSSGFSCPHTRNGNFIKRSNKLNGNSDGRQQRQWSHTESNMTSYILT